MRKLITMVLCSTLMACGDHSDFNTSDPTDLSVDVKIDSQNAQSILNSLAHTKKSTDLLSLENKMIESDTIDSQTKDCSEGGNIKSITSQNQEGIVSVALTLTACKQEETTINGAVYMDITKYNDATVSSNITGNINIRNGLESIDMNSMRIKMVYDTEKTITITSEVDIKISSTDFSGNFSTRTAPNITIDANGDVLGKEMIIGADNSKIEMIHNANGTHYYINGVLL